MLLSACRSCRGLLSCQQLLLCGHANAAKIFHLCSEWLTRWLWLWLCDWYCLLRLSCLTWFDTDTTDPFAMNPMFTKCFACWQMHCTRPMLLIAKEAT